MKYKVLTLIVTFYLATLAYPLCAAVSITPENASQLIVDADATDEVVALFYNLSQTAKLGTIVGQQDGYSRRVADNKKEYNSQTDVYLTTGCRPMTSGEDIQFLTDDKNTFQSNNWYHQQVQFMKETVVKSYDEHGVFTSFSWHFREPYEGKHFYSKELSDAVKVKAFKSLLVGGEKHEYYKDKLDAIADFFKSLKDKNGKLIPAIFRPFHEMEGKWFWWGIPHYATPAEYKQVWQFTVKYLRDECDVHNVLYAFSPDKNFTTEQEYLTCYPGDDYVDIVGFDTYDDYSKGESIRLKTVGQLRIIDKLAKEKGKIAAITECGYDFKTKPAINKLYSEHYYSILEDSGADIAYMMFWAGDFLPTLTTDTLGLANDLKLFFEKERILSEHNVPDLYEIVENKKLKMSFEIMDANSPCAAESWDVANDNDYGYFSRTNSKAQQGNSSMKMNFPANFTALNNYYLISSELTPATTDKKYKLSCWVYIEKLGQLKSLYMIFSGIKWTQTEVNLTDLAKGQWVKIESDYYIPTTNGNIKPAIKPQINSSLGGADKEVLLYIDNIEITEENATDLELASTSTTIAVHKSGALIQNATTNTPVSVCNLLTALLVYSSVIRSEKHFIPLDSGIYSVKVGAFSKKIML